jgi:hypothetical protein
VEYEFSFPCPNCKNKVSVLLENLTDFFLWCWHTVICQRFTEPIFH